MPDADDFDVEYFRNLLKGNSPKEGHAAPAEPSRAVAKSNPNPTRPPAAWKEGNRPAAGRKKSKNR